jgi:hypothetical protein
MGGVHAFVGHHSGHGQHEFSGGGASMKAWLMAALLATLAAAWFAPDKSADEVIQLTPRSSQSRAQPSPVRAAETTAATTPGRSADPTANGSPAQRSTQGITQGTAEPTVLTIRPRESLEDPANDLTSGSQLFAATQWTLPPPVEQASVTPVEVAPPPPPQAPPLPFQYLGRYADAGQEVIFLQRNDQNLVVRVGDTLEGVYKLNGLNDNVLNFTYLPLMQPQTLSMNPAP